MPIKHEWNGTILTITSDSGTSSADLKGAKGATGARGARGLRGERGNGATIEDGVIATDSTWSSSGIMDRFAEQIGTEGNPVVINEPLPNFPYSITASFDVKQEGTGEPYPAGAGKNKLNITAVSTTSNGITYTVKEDGSVICNGTNTVIDTFVLSREMLPTGSYRLLGCPAGGSNSGDGSYRLQTNIKMPDGTMKYISDVGNGANFILEETPETIQVFIILAKNGTYNNLTFKPMIISADETDLTYAPYSNIRPIEGYDSISITRSGKNLLNFPDREAVEIAGVVVSCSNGVVSFKGTSTGVVHTNGKGIIDTPTLPNGTYKTTGGTSNVEVFAKVIENGTAKYYYKGENFTISNTNILEMISCRVASGKTVDETIYPMLVLANETDLTYETYKGNTYTISLDNTYYQGILDVNRGELIVDRGYIELNGSEENWAVGGSNFYIPIDGIKQEVGNLLSNQYINAPTKQVNTLSANEMRQGATPTNVVFGNPNDALTLDEWKTKIAENPIQLVYELAEPQVIKLTAEEIKAISGNNTLYSNADNLYVFGRIDTMKQLQALMERVSALEAKVGV